VAVNVEHVVAGPPHQLADSTRDTVATDTLNPLNPVDELVADSA
jgi:hypothetical protein